MGSAAAFVQPSQAHPGLWEGMPGRADRAAGFKGPSGITTVGVLLLLP